MNREFSLAKVDMNNSHSDDNFLVSRILWLCVLQLQLSHSAQKIGSHLTGHFGETFQPKDS